MNALPLYRMPAEWEPHDATWLAWPINEETWPGMIADVEKVYTEMARALAEANETVRILALNEKEAERILKHFCGFGDIRGRIEAVPVPYNDSWMRDAGPIFVWSEKEECPRELVALDFTFNTWGEKYGPWDLDDVIAQKIAERYGFRVIVHDMVLEGGSIDVNGSGTLLTTKQCLLNPNRNPSLSQNQIEQRLKESLGVETILWLGDGIDGDDTDGHVDDITRFTSADTIVTVVEPDPSSPNHAPLKRNLDILKNTSGPEGGSYNIAELPMPERPVEGPFGPCPASYANFYIANEAVLVPVYSSKNDERALDILRELFPGRSVRGIECSALVAGLGSIHCVTQQQPANR